MEGVANILRLCGRIATVNDLPEMLKATADTLAAMLPADRVSVIEFDLSARRIGHFVGGGPAADKIQTDIQFEELWEGLSGWVLREHKPALSAKDAPDRRESASVHRRRLETGAGSIIVVPFMSQDKVVGTMTAINTPEQENFTEAHLETMELFSTICAMAVETTRRLLQLQDSERQLLDENDLKDRLFGVLAHDLRGPIGNLRSLLTMVSERIEEPEVVRELVGIGLQSATRTFRLTENLLTWIRGQIKGIDLPVVRVVVSDLLQVVKDILDPEAALKNVSILVEVAASLTLDTEPNAIETIVRNLVANAVKFSPPGAQVVVSAERDGPEVIFEVRDSGVGMTEEQVAGLFRGRPVNPLPGTTGEQGNGLGLMISSDLAKTIGGWLEASSTLGRGSTIRLIVSDADPEEL